MFSSILKNTVIKAKKHIFYSYSFYSTYSNKVLNCANVGVNLSEQKVTLYGWFHNSRLNGSMLILRDSSGIVQLITNNPSIKENLPPNESVIKVSGIVKNRPAKDINKRLKSGVIEVHIDELEVINKAYQPLPFYTKNVIKSLEMLRIKYRYLDFRSEDMQRMLKFRSITEFKFSEFLIKMNDFVNVTTPSLFKSTPGGSREFIVPTKEPGMCYALIQSPQQHKQLLMSGGVDRYMQIARCYRNEMSRPDRQPEFTQLDIEMSFVERRHLQSLIEDMLLYSVNILHKHLTKPFPVFSFDEAMKLYGTDKPDIRFEMKIEDFVFSDAQFLGLRVAKENITFLNLENINSYIQKNYPDKNLKIINCSESKIYSETLKKELNEDYVFILENTNNINDYKALGNVRRIIASQSELNGQPIYKRNYAVAWIEGFPLFEKKNGVLQSVHHQFTAPIKEHYELLFTDPEKVISEQFDLVCNGQEIGGGSIRVHDPDIQEYIIKDILKEDVSLFSHLLLALRSGTPPHGGFALGIERFIAVISGCDSIRDVIAFPKTVDGKDLLSGAPSEISVEQSDYYNLNFINKSSINKHYGE